MVYSVKTVYKVCGIGFNVITARIEIRGFRKNEMNVIGLEKRQKGVEKV